MPLLHVVKRVGEAAERDYISETPRLQLRRLQAIVGGFVEVVAQWPGGAPGRTIRVFGDEDGRTKNLPRNFENDGDVAIVGDVAVVAEDDRGEIVAMTEAEALAAIGRLTAWAAAADEASEDARTCQGHPAGPHDPMGQTVYCDGTCRAAQRLAQRWGLA